MVIKTIILDVGGVIVGIDNMKVCKNLAKHCNHNPKEIYDVIFHSTIMKRFEKGLMTPKEYYLHAKEKLRLDIGYEKFREIYQDNVKALNKDIISLMRRSKGKYRIILLSNNNAIHFTYQKKDSCHIFSIPKKKIISYKVKTRKPEKKIYKIAIKHAMTAPSKILYLDDLKKNVVAAKKLGINAVQYRMGMDLRKILNKYNISL